MSNIGIKQWEATTNIFFSNDGSPVVTLGSKNGQTLNLIGTASGNVANAAGVNKSVQFNDDTEFFGNEDFLYDKDLEELTVNNIKGQQIYYNETSDSLGFNEIYRGPGQPWPQETASTHVASNYNFGYDVDISESGVMAFACPNYVYAASTGGVNMQSISSDVITQYSSALTFSNFTLEATVSSAGITEGGDYVAFVDNSALGWCYVYKWNGTAWVFLSESFDSYFHQVKISKVGDVITLIGCDDDTNFFIYEIDKDTGVFTKIDDIFTGTTTNSDYLPMAISQNMIIFSALDNTYIYGKLEGVWTLIDSIVTTDVNDVDIYDVGGNQYFMTVATDDGLIIRDSTKETFQTFEGIYLACACNDSIVYGYKGVAIEVYQKISDGIFTKNFNDTVLAGVNKMSASLEFLVCSQTISNMATIYKREAYTNSEVVITAVVLKNDDKSLQLSAGYGSTITTPLLGVTGDLEIGGKIGVGDGTVSVPSIHFEDPDTGIYCAGAIVGVSINGVKQLEVSDDLTSVTGQLQLEDGDANAPCLVLGTDDTGLYRVADTIAVSCNQNTVLTVDEQHVVSYVPYKSYGDGSATDPVYSFVSEPSTGMYYEGTHDSVVLTSGGINVASFQEEQAFFCDVSLGNGADVNSAYANGSVVKIVNNAASGRAGIESVVLGGSNTHMAIYDTGLVGSIVSTSVSTSYNTSSSILLKKDIVPVNTAEELEKVMLLKPVHFSWRKNNIRDSGFIASDVEQVFPKCICGTDLPDENGIIDYKQLDKSHFTYALVAGVQQLKKEIEELKEHIRSIREEMATFI